MALLFTATKNRGQKINHFPFRGLPLVRRLASTKGGGVFLKQNQGGGGVQALRLFVEEQEDEREEKS